MSHRSVEGFKTETPLSYPPARQWTLWYDSVPWSSSAAVQPWRDSPEPQLVWEAIRLLSDVREIGAKLFTGSLSECNKSWRALNDFTRQSKAYYDALEGVRGSSRGLLAYYSALNLAKAELLHKEAQLVINTRIKHGLHFDVAGPSTIKSDQIVVPSHGVFPLLYKARTGRTLTKGTKLPVRRLLANVPEVGHEYQVVFGERSCVVNGWARVVGDGASIWLTILLDAEPHEIDRRYGWSRILQDFETVSLPGTWRQAFSNIPPLIRPATMLQGRELFSAYDAEVGIKNAVDKMYDSFGSSLEPNTAGEAEFRYVPGLYKAQSLVMPSSLARYALTYYLSSLVRYRPSRLNPEREQLTVWLLDAFARQAPLYMLISGLEGIEQCSHVFNQG